MDKSFLKRPIKNAQAGDLCFTNEFCHIIFKGFVKKNLRFFSRYFFEKVKHHFKELLFYLRSVWQNLRFFDQKIPEPISKLL